MNKMLTSDTRKFITSLVKSSYFSQAKTLFTMRFSFSPRDKVVPLLFLAMALAPVSSAQELASINFRDADINSLIESVAEITGRSFVIDPRVRGNVTIIAPTGIEPEMLYQAFLSALQVQGFQAVDDGPVVRIVPFNQAFGILGGGANELETRLIKINNVDAASLVPAIRPLLNTNARLQAFADSNYLIVTDIKANVTQLIELVKELDDPSLNTLEVIDLEFISPGEAVYIVNQLQAGQQQLGLSIVEDSLNNRIIISGPSTVRTTFKNMLRALDSPTNRSAGVEVVFLNYVKAVNIKPIIDGLLQSVFFLQLVGEGDTSANFRTEVDEANNALVIAASPEAIKEIKTVINQLDRMQPQVLIEVIIAELSEDQAQRLSSQILYSNQNNGAAITNFDSLLLSLVGIGTDLIDDVPAVLGQVQGIALGGGNFDADNGRGFGLLVQALKSDKSTKVLSTPSIVTINNEEASLSIGTEVPFITGSFTTNAEGTNNPFQTISREDVGIKLVVTPQIGYGDVVRLSLDQESSNIIGGAAQLGAADVITSKSSIITNVTVTNGELLVLGGLINDQFETADDRVPFLGNIPVLGQLFRSTVDSDDGRVLMMFVRPTILRGVDDASDLSQKRFDYLINHELSKDTGIDITPLLEGFREK